MDGAAPKLDPATETALGTLKDIATPAPVSWLPQTWGWVLLALVVLAGLSIWIGIAIRRYRANRYRRDALRELSLIEQNMRDPATCMLALQELAALLKRVMLAAWPRTEVAALTGAAWVDFLRRHDGASAEDALATVLDGLEYHRRSDVTILPSSFAAELTSSARRWIANHHV